MRTTIDFDDALLQRLRGTAHGKGVPCQAVGHRVILCALEETPALTYFTVASVNIALFTRKCTQILAM